MNKQNTELKYKEKALMEILERYFELKEEGVKLNDHKMNSLLSWYSTKYGTKRISSNHHKELTEIIRVTGGYLSEKEAEKIQHELRKALDRRDHEREQQ